MDYQNEITSLRSHSVKHFPHPTEEGKMICVKTSGIFHAKVGGEFVDIKAEMDDFSFPEGKSLAPGQQRHEIMTLPSWGRHEVEDGGKVVRVYDEDDVPIFRYSNPCAMPVPTGDMPYVVKVDGLEVRREHSPKKFDPSKGETIEIDELAVSTELAVEDGKLVMVLPEVSETEMLAFDDTDTTSSIDANSALDKNNPDLNESSFTFGRAQQYSDGNWIRDLLRFTTPNLSGTISDIKLYLYAWDIQASGSTVTCYKCLRTDWVESEVTWNIYKTGSNWTTAGCSGAGTDYDSSEVDSMSGPAGAGYVNFVLYGTGATNPITPAWNTTYNFLIKDDEGGTGGYAIYHKENGSNVWYVEITYTPSADTSAMFLMF